MMSRAVAVIVFLHSLHGVQSIFSSVGSYRKVLRQLMTWWVPFRFGQVLLFFWCHCTCLLYSLFQQLPGRDGISWFLSILDNTVFSSLLGLASDCFERLQVPLVKWPFIFSFCQSNVLVFYAWSLRWESLALRCSLSKVCQGSAMNDAMSVVFRISAMLSFLSVWHVLLVSSRSRASANSVWDAAIFCRRWCKELLVSFRCGISLVARLIAGSRTKVRPSLCKCFERGCLNDTLCWV